MSDQESTRDRLLESAGEVFTRMGYRDATVAEICEGARANVAAVNYHFGDKRSLYDAVWRLALETFRATYPLPDPDAGDPETRLQLAVHALLSAALDSGRAGWMPKLQLREMAEPTEALPDMVRESIIPTRRALMRIVADVIGGEVPEEQVALCTMSLVSQILFLSCSAPVRQQLAEQKQFSEPPREIYAKHIVDYNMSALRSMSAARRHGQP